MPLVREAFLPTGSTNLLLMRGARGVETVQLPGFRPAAGGAYGTAASVERAMPSLRNDPRRPALSTALK
jgi:hypothetical protein